MAGKGTETGGPDQEFLALLTGLLEEFKKQVQSKTPAPLTEDAQKAVDAFKEISEALNVRAAGSSSTPASSR